jgi:secondary thiamine-phosphate synthase enzyme
MNMILKFNTKGNTDIIDITQKIQEEIENNKIESGSVLIFVKGSTAAITTIESDPNLYQDLREVLEELIPIKRNWKHHQTWNDDNGASHLRASLIGPSLMVPIENSQLILGTWQKIVLIDFDTRPRSREVILKIISS